MTLFKGPQLAWICLLIAGLLEIVWALAMKTSQGFTRGDMTALTVVAMGLSVWLLSIAVRSLPVGTAYAVWTGIGAAGAAIFGIVLFGEPAGAARLACLTLIIAGVVGLKLLAG
jgi:quaternary ammonium compound-resistance protein SugE